MNVVYYINNISEKNTLLAVFLIRNFDTRNTDKNKNLKKKTVFFGSGNHFDISRAHNVKKNYCNTFL